MRDEIIAPSADHFAWFDFTHVSTVNDSVDEIGSVRYPRSDVTFSPTPQGVGTSELERVLVVVSKGTH